MIFVTSDTHFHHRNIVLGTSDWTDKVGCRDFDTLDEHDDVVVQIINAAVGPEDTLWHLGDWSFGGRDQVKRFRERLNCNHIHLLIGNHDHHIAQREAEQALFESVQYYKELKIKGFPPVVLMHYPIESWNGQSSGSIHLHGHTHGSSAEVPFRQDVGLDVLWDVYSLEQLVSLIQSRDGQPHLRYGHVEGRSKFGN